MKIEIHNIESNVTDIIISVNCSNNEINVQKVINKVDQPVQKVNTDSDENQNTFEQKENVIPEEMLNSEF